MRDSSRFWAALFLGVGWPILVAASASASPCKSACTARSEGCKQQAKRVALDQILLCNGSKRERKACKHRAHQGFASAMSTCRSDQHSCRSCCRAGNLDCPQPSPCANGSVAPGGQCDDGNPCTADTCDPVRGCQHGAVANGTSCSDGNACNGAETCQGGTCTPGTSLNCDDHNACTSDTCDPVKGCQHTPVTNGTSCSDGNACNGAETCQAGTCTGTPLNCDDHNACTSDTCDPVKGCQHVPVPSCTMVPNVIGDLLPQAEGELSAARLLVGDENASFDSSIQPGSVTTENPIAGTSVQSNTTVDLGFALPDNDLPDHLRFLTPAGQIPDDDGSATAYYNAIGAGGLQTLDQWLARNNFPAGDTAAATYINEGDLGFIRQMHMRRNSPTSIAYYVQNFRQRDNALLATVAMEYSPGPTSATPFTKFFAFQPTGALELHVDLDGQGEKYLPGICTPCHGGGSAPLNADGSYPNGGNINAGFLPFDLDSFGYLPAHPRAEQEAGLMALNQELVETNPPTAVKELIKGWYGSSAGSCSPGTFCGSFRPDGWNRPQAPPTAAVVYDTVVKHSCRSCHVAIAGTFPGTDSSLAFATFTDFAARRADVNLFVCERGEMPLALQTYRNFWISLGGSPDGPTTLGQFLTTNVTRVAPATDGPALSGDGTLLAFVTDAPLDPADTNGVSDVYSVDLRQRTVPRLESVRANVSGVDGASYGPLALSSDGRYLVFGSAGQLDPADTNDFGDVYIRDRQAPAPQVLSNGGADSPTIAGDGVLVAYRSGHNGCAAIEGFTGSGQFICSAPPTVIVGNRLPYQLLDCQACDPSVDGCFGGCTVGSCPVTLSEASGTCPDGSTPDTPALSDDGNLLAFSSDATNLTPEPDFNGATDVFVRDLMTGEGELASLSTTGIPGDGPSGAPAISADGRFVVFQSYATTLLGPNGDQNGQPDVFVHDRQTRETERVSVSSSNQEANGPSGAPVISEDGRFVAFVSTATNLASSATTPGRSHVYLRDRWRGTTTLLSHGLTGGEANDSSLAPALSADGKTVGFVSRASDLTVDAPDGAASHVFVLDLSVPTPTCGTSLPGERPVAIVSVDSQLVDIGTTVSFDGGHSLFAASYSWSLVRVPGGSNATLDNTPGPTMTDLKLDQPGTYVVRLDVTNTLGNTDSAWAVASARAVGSPPDPQITFDKVQSIFNASCNISCHNSQNLSEGLNLSPNAAYGALLGDGSGAQAQECKAKLVVPSHPEQSFLLTKIGLSEAQVPCTAGTTMPPSGTLSSQSQTAISLWIKQGAQPPQ
jgi:Tol biopolymer transport system component